MSRTVPTAGYAKTVCYNFWYARILNRVVTTRFGRSSRAVDSSTSQRKGEDIEMKRFLPSGIMIFAGVLGIAATTAQAEQDVTKTSKKFDLRETILRRFLRDHHCPDASYAPVFVKEADTHRLDWRLLPSLSFVESGGGKHARGNNLFGWANGKWTFDSIGEAIHHVAEVLSYGRAYRGKTLEAKLATYNHNIDYKAMVFRVMRQISATPDLESAD